ncbi:MHYT domain-containing protein [Robbsia sp. KACC 23696]|uniref:MHYT domain-containing protein n=1 Tax=Robbsia sp. KACC 23696 TaxID=3149231 RepID=UPI00325AEC9A
MVGTFSPTLVVLSLIIASLASYTVLDLTAFISFLERPRVKHAWLAAGATAMGIGIWSMHFVGMLAFSLPIPLGYDLTITAASLVLAIIVSYFALHVVIRPDLSPVHIGVGGVLMGCGIAGMHYAGMAAMRMQPGIEYDPLRVAESLVIAIAASTAALWIANALTSATRRHLVAKRLGAAVIMGLAITGMHYVGMSAAHFLPGAVCGAARGTNMQWLATTVIVLTLMILAVTLLVSRFDARTAFLRRMTHTLEGQLHSRTGELERAVHQHAVATQALDHARLKIEQELLAQRETATALTEDIERQRRENDTLKRTLESLLNSAASSVEGAPICALPGMLDATPAYAGATASVAAPASRVAAAYEPVTDVAPTHAADTDAEDGLARVEATHESMQRLSANLIALKARLQRLFHDPSGLATAPSQHDTAASASSAARATDPHADPTHEQILTLVDETIDLALHR